jgi:site-specific DNA-cytosine methylase
MHPRPAVVDGTQWWADPLLTAAESARARHPAQPVRHMLHHANCAGTGCEREIFRVLGIAATTAAMSDKKPASRKFLQEMHREDFEGGTRMFNSMDDLRANADSSAKKSTENTKEPLARPDCASQGLPCQPFSRQRSSSATPEEPTGYDSVFVQFFEYLDSMKPRGIIVEEVPEFGKRKGPDGVSYLTKFVEECELRGFFVVVLEMEAGIWGSVTRKRLYIVGCSSDLGGEAGAMWIANMVDQIVQFRSLTGPTDIRSMIGAAGASSGLDYSAQAFSNAATCNRHTAPAQPLHSGKFF